MRLAYPLQKFQDWFTQQWVILWGRRIEPDTAPWLMGPFGKPGSTTDHFVDQLAEDENLVIEKTAGSHGLISSMKELKLADAEYDRLSSHIVDFYENTTNYKLTFSVEWNPLFRVFGNLVAVLFSNRIRQLNIPAKNIEALSQINSEIIPLKERESGKLKYTIWYRTFVSTRQVLYSGVYSTCTLPSGNICVKAVFPLPKGNATVIMSPSVGPGGELRLDSAGKKFGDPGFYFLLNDSKGDFWSQYVGSFRDHLNVYSDEGNIFAEQTLTLWHQRVLQIKYEIQRKI